MGNSYLYNSARFELHHDKDIIRTKQPVIYNGKVASPNVFGMFLQDGGPSLARIGCYPCFRQVLLDSTFAYLDIQFQQFATDPICPP